ncbi:MAG: VOC family protein [Myxococcales bacterium]|nr:VOC family protein [Myxococcales bacterium]
MPQMEITGYEHVGIRVSDRERAIAFYGELGFQLVSDLPEHRALVLETAGGVKINLIYNATPRPSAANVLMDEAVKHPGVTHPAFVVSSLDDTVAHLEERGIRLTEGPLRIEDRRICFVRDPDGNVVEFDEYV